MKTFLTLMFVTIAALGNAMFALGRKSRITMFNGIKKQLDTTIPYTVSLISHHTLLAALTLASYLTEGMNRLFQHNTRLRRAGSGRLSKVVSDWHTLT